MNSVKRFLTVMLFIVPTLIFLPVSGAALERVPYDPDAECLMAPSWPEDYASVSQTAALDGQGNSTANCPATFDLLANYPPSSVLPAHAGSSEVASVAQQDENVLANYPPSSVLPAHADVTKDDSLAQQTGFEPMCDSASNVPIYAPASLKASLALKQGNDDCAMVIVNPESGSLVACQTIGGPLEFMNSVRLCTDAVPPETSVLANQRELPASICTVGDNTVEAPGIEGSITDMNGFMQSIRLGNLAETGGDGRSC